MSQSFCGELRKGIQCLAEDDGEALVKLFISEDGYEKFRKIAGRPRRPGREGFVFLLLKKQEQLFPLKADGRKPRHHATTILNAVLQDLDKRHDADALLMKEYAKEKFGEIIGDLTKEQDNDVSRLMYEARQKLITNIDIFDSVASEPDN